MNANCESREPCSEPAKRPRLRKRVSFIVDYFLGRSNDKPSPRNASTQSSLSHLTWHALYTAATYRGISLRHTPELLWVGSAALCAQLKPHRDAGGDWAAKKDAKHSNKAGFEAWLDGEVAKNMGVVRVR